MDEYLLLKQRINVEHTMWIKSYLKNIKKKFKNINKLNILIINTFNKY